MGSEIVFVLIYPITAACIVAAIFFWFEVASFSGNPIRAYAALAIGYGISILGLAFLSYIDGYAVFTELVQQGYYAESDRSLYLPRRVMGAATLTSVFVLPAVSFIVVPLTARRIKKGRLTVRWIALFAIASWLIISLLGLLLSARSMVDPFAFANVLSYTAAPVMVYGLPIPLITLLLLRKQREVDCL